MLPNKPGRAARNKAEQVNKLEELQKRKIPNGIILQAMTAGIQLNMEASFPQLKACAMNDKYEEFASLLIRSTINVYTSAINDIYEQTVHKEQLANLDVAPLNVEVPVSPTKERRGSNKSNQ